MLPGGPGIGGSEAPQWFRALGAVPPGLWLTSIARRKVLAYPEKSGVLSDALETALALPLRWSDVDHAAVLRLALSAKLTTYDASYLYLARALGATLATFDKRLLRAAQGSGP